MFVRISFFAVAALVSFVVALSVKGLADDALFVYERAVLAALPSAERAFRYGSAHLNSRNVLAYDVRRAGYFLHRALALDASHPFARHELARVAFLLGNFNEALTLIDEQIGRGAPANAHYVRGLILGYMGRYGEAARAYEVFLADNPTNWAAANDYAWVLLKDGHPREAATAVEHALGAWPENPWLLNSAAIAAYEMGERDSALAFARRASERVRNVTRDEWLVAYPGNDPRVADDGLAALARSIENNMHTIEGAAARGAVQ